MNGAYNELILGESDGASQDIDHQMRYSMPSPGKHKGIIIVLMKEHSSAQLEYVVTSMLKVS